MGDRKGGTAVEYALILALIVLAMIGGLIGLANATISLWGNVSNHVIAVSPGT